jgi:hypothetical protein
MPSEQIGSGITDVIVGGGCFFSEEQPTAASSSTLESAGKQVGKRMVPACVQQPCLLVASRFRVLASSSGGRVYRLVQPAVRGRTCRSTRPLVRVAMCASVLPELPVDVQFLVSPV